MARKCYSAKDTKYILRSRVSNWRAKKDLKQGVKTRSDIIREKKQKAFGYYSNDWRLVATKKSISRYGGAFQAGERA